MMLLDEERNELVPRAIRGPNPVYREQAPIRVGEGIAGMVAQSGEPVAVADVRLDPRYRYRDIARQEGFCSLLCVPLRVRERTIGVLNCYTGEPHTFSEQEVSLFTTLANQTALALENARLATSAAVVREMHHRIKNNLQSVIMLLRLQMTEGGELSARDVLHEAINRIQSIATVHEVLSHRGLQAVEVRDLLKRVVESVARNMASPQLQLAMQVEGEAFSLPSQPATSLALVINELTQNAVEHAFVGRERGSIHIVLGREGDNWLITVRDNGVGLPERPLPQLGLQIVETLVREDLHGSIQFARDEGTIATIRIPRPNGGSSQGTPWARQQEEEHAYTHRR
ncbi:MAG: GAF domain-containing protein [Thiobacillaceae bacterium]